MLKNLMLFKLQTEWTMTPGSLEQVLEQHKLIPPSKLATVSRGWAPVGPNGEYVFSTEKQMLFCAATETKVIPPSTVRREVAAKAKEVEERMGFKVGKKQMREIKDQVMTELLAKAMTKVDETKVWIDAMNGYLAVDTGSGKKADEITAMLRDHLGGSLQIVIPEGEISPTTLMNKWLMSGKATHGMRVGESGELVSSDGKKSTAKFVRHELVGCAEVTSHVDNGKVVSKLELNWNDSADFVLTEKMQIKSIKYATPEDVADEKEQDAATMFEANFRLTTYALQGIVGGLSGAMGFKE